MYRGHYHHWLTGLSRLDLERQCVELRELYGDMVNQFAMYFTKNGVEMVGTGGLSDLEAAFSYYGLSDPCTLEEFRGKTCD